MKAGKVLHIILAVFVALFISGHILLNNKTIQRNAASHVVKIAQTALGTDVSAGRVQLTYPFGIKIEELTVYDTVHDTLAHVPSISLRLKPLLLLENKLSITSVRVNSPIIRLYTDSTGAEPNYAFLKSLSGRNDRKMAFRANSILVRNGSVKYDNRSAGYTDSLFNKDHIDISGLTANLSLKSLDSDSVAVIIRKLTFSEQSGFRLAKTKGVLTVSGKETRLYGLDMTTPNSRLEAERLVADIGLTSPVNGVPSFDINLNATLTGKDFKAFLPQLASMTDPVDITVKGKTDNVGEIVLDALNVHAPGNMIKMGMNGTILMDSSLNITGFKFAKAQGTFRDGMPAWLESQLEGFGIRIPDQIKTLGNGDFKVSLNSDSKQDRIDSDLELNSLAGSLICKLNGNNGVYNGTVDAKNVNLHTITGNSSLGNCTLSAQAQALKQDKGFSGNFKGDIASLIYNKYDYRNIIVNGSFDSDMILSDLHFSDRNGTLSLNAGIGKGKNPFYRIGLNADSLNLYAYHLTEKENMTMTVSMDADLTGKNADEITGKISVDSLYYADISGDWFMDNFTVEIGELQDFVRIISVNSDFMNMSITGHYNLSTLPGSLAKACGDVLPTIGNLVGTKLKAGKYNRNSNSLALEAHINNLDILEKVFNYPVSISKPVYMQFALVDKDSTCSGYLSVPEVIISGKRLSEGNMTLNSAEGTCYTEITGYYGDRDEDGIAFKANLMAFMDIVRGKYSWKSETGQMSGDAKTLSQFFRYDTRNGLNSLTFIDTTSIMVNGTMWNLSISRLSTDKHKITISDFCAKNDSQYLYADGTVSADSIDIFKLSMTRINIGRTLSVLKPAKKFGIQGLASGYLSISSALSKPAFYGSFQIEDFRFMDSYHGLLTADCRWNQQARQVELDGLMVDEGVETTGFSGIYIPQSKTIDVSLAANHTDLRFLNTWTRTVFRELGGRATGNLRLFGSLPGLDLEGEAILEDGYFVQDAINSTFLIKHDTLWFEPGRMLFRDVEFYDEKGHDGIMTCILTHNKFKNWKVLTYMLMPELPLAPESAITPVPVL